MLTPERGLAVSVRRLLAGRRRRRDEIRRSQVDMKSWRCWSLVVDQQYLKQQLPLAISNSTGDVLFALGLS